MPERRRARRAGEAEAEDAALEIAAEFVLNVCRHGAAALPFLLAAGLARGIYTVPRGITTPDKPNIPSTIWRTVTDQKQRTYYYESTFSPSVVWVKFADLDFGPASGVLKLQLDRDSDRAGNQTGGFQPAEPYLAGATEQAVCLAALTYDPDKAGISAYFTVAIHRALAKEMLARRNPERRMQVAWNICKPHLNPHIERMKHRAVQALQMLSPYEKQLLEDHLIEGVTLERLSREQAVDRRIIRKRINKAIENLREAEKDLP